jgi:hypothetical protein
MTSMIAKTIQCVGASNSPIHPPVTSGHYSDSTSPAARAEFELGP